MKLLANYRILALFIIIALMLSACGGGDDNANDQTLPTLAATLDLGAAQTAGSSDGPPIDASSTTEQSGDAPIDLSGPPGVDSSTPNTDVTTVTDFSTLSIGDYVRVVGIVSFDEDTESSDPVAVITDNMGNQIILTGFPLPMIESLVGQEVSQEGTIGSAPEGDTRLVFNSSGPGFAGSVTSAGPSVDNSLPPGLTGDGTTDSGPSAFDPQLTTTDFTLLSLELEPNLTALEIYDALLLELSGDLLGAELIEIRGNENLGWFLRFIREGSSTDYFVAPDGTVRQSQSSPLDSGPGAEPLPIDRSRVLVDSDQALSIISAADSGPVIAVALRATADGGIVWAVDGFPVDPVDATVAP